MWTIWNGFRKRQLSSCGERRREGGGCGILICPGRNARGLMRSEPNAGRRAAMHDIRILALAGSLRKGSLNQALIHAARELAPDHVRIEDFDLRTVPFYDGDLEAAGDPEEVVALKSAIADSDALLIATPEYNGS